MSDKVRIIEMGPRDGLQNEKTPVSVESRIAFIKKLLGAGLSTIEVGAFVSPKGIPQMVGSDEVLRAVNQLAGEFHVLVPNEKGYEAARACGAKVVSIFTAASEGFARANINCSIAESIERFKPVMARAKADGVRVRGYISTVLGCPFDGEIKPKAVAKVAKKLWTSVATKSHSATPSASARQQGPKPCYARSASMCRCQGSRCIFHDTYGQALANLYAGME